MELLEGETLEAVLRREGRLALPKVAELVRQIARALGKAHDEGVAHRDSKPANVFITHDEDGQLVAKLLDFGIARAIHGHRRPDAVATAKGLVFGTPSYMSPEQARGSSRLDHRCDLWALATIAYEASTAELPLEGNDTDELLKNLCSGTIVPVGARDPQLQARLGPFFERAFADDITQRFQGAGELATAFARAVGVSVGEASVPSTSELAAGDGAVRPDPRRRRALLAAGAVVVATAAVGLAWRAFARSPVAEPVVAPAASAPATSTAAIASPVTATTPTPDPSVDPPTVSLSALPRAPLVPTFARPPTPAPPSASPAPPAATVVAPPVPPSPTRKDRSEVF